MAEKNDNMKVYIVAYSDYDIYDIRIVCSSEEKARNYIAKQSKRDQKNLDVDQWIVDVPYTDQPL